MKELITVATAHYNATKFIEVSLDALMKLTTNEFRVIICDNGSSEPEIRKLKELKELYHPHIEVIFRQQSVPGDASIGHGEASNILVENINTPYGVFLESDAIFLKKGWDEIMIKELKGKTKIVGCPMTENPLRPTDFPSVFATMFDTKAFKSLKIDMRSKNIKIGLDTGWEMREKFLAAGYKSKTFEAKKTREYKQSPFQNVLCGVYYFKGMLMASHFGRGSSLGEAKYKGPKFIRRMIGQRELERWLRICREIVDKEAK